MAKIEVKENKSIFQLKKWLGLNESPDGDTGLKMGEAAVMRNFLITRENHLQIRPGYAPVCTLSEGNPVRGMWHGYVAGEAHLLAACGGHLWDIDTVTWAAEDLGEIVDSGVSFFGFAKKVYLLTGSEYYCWSGEGTVSVVEGYVPVVVTAAPPEGGGTLLERINMLTGKKRARYSPDGEATVFQLPESALDEVIGVEGTDIAWTADLTAGTVTFSSAPEKGVNTLEIAWKKGNGERERITSMRFAELYNGASDSRVFLYGNDSNEAVYSDLDNDGKETAEYFPDLNTMAVGSANTPITALIRHYDRMLAFKTDCAYAVLYNSITLSDNVIAAAFYATPLNREIGCEAPGQAHLVQNNARTLFGRSCYEWALTYGAARDERNAKRISERIETTMSRFFIPDCIAFDDEQRQEYYVVYGDEALVHNYSNDVWYYYNNFPARCLDLVDGELYFGTGDGRLMHLSRSYRNDDLSPIDAYWESGSMDFGQDWKRKYCSNIWVSIKPESQSNITVTAQSNQKSQYVERDISYSIATFGNASFKQWSFGVNRKPQVQRTKIKVKKFTFYKLIFKSVSVASTATILATDFEIRYTGNVK